uniref:RNA-directed DNA polymerase, eukaryota, reverse transcriptase zinc-binding domain protein n=1 Tax=Tanacetum cinerariifolium TaxID=118510 RepID=A0A699HJN6_TANCI|nr:RNA-directed DNA polymerase, eukaryota, reverse transcriptase zinc-binding domain protein [Tanacetum cinerariifolium]
MDQLFEHTKKKNSYLILLNDLKKVDAPRIQLNFDFTNTLNIDQQSDLEREVAHDEIKMAVWGCGTDKSPGPDGFTFGFDRRYWSILEKDVKQAVRYFFHYEVFSKVGNSSFITLIPKTPNVNKVKDFRPITLIGSLYKIISKILANHLVDVLGDIVNQVVVDAGMFLGIAMGTSWQLSHLFYADDAVFMRQWSDVNIDIIIKVLECFYRASRLRINMNKSRLMRISVANNVVNQAANNISCTMLTPPFSNLGSKVLQEMESIRCYFFNGIDQNGIHGDDGKLNSTTSYNHSSIWLSIVREMTHLKDNGLDLFVFLSKKDGEWVGYFLLARFAEKMAYESLGYPFRRNPRSGIEQTQFDNLLAQLEGVDLVDMLDRLHNVSTKTRWTNVVPIKINVHAWKVKMDCLPARFNICRRGMEIDSIICPSCDATVESTSHIFFNFNLAKEVFHKIVNW